ncbi:hypothetical protein AB7M47_004943 [Bradyrhizobium elkanii]
MQANYHHLDGIEIAFVSGAAASFVALVALLVWPLM